MRRLFDGEYETYTEPGNRFALLASKAIRPIVDAARAEGLSLRDLSYILISEVGIEISMAILHRNSEIVKKVRKL